MRERCDIPCLRYSASPCFCKHGCNAERQLTVHATLKLHLRHCSSTTLDRDSLMLSINMWVGMCHISKDRWSIDVLHVLMPHGTRGWVYSDSIRVTGFQGAKLLYLNHRLYLNTMSPETVAEFLLFDFLRYQNYVTAPETISPTGPSCQNYGMEMVEIPCKNYGAQQKIQGDFCDVIFTLRCPKLIVQN